MSANVTRHESNTARFGRVITYRCRVREVTFTAERVVGLHDDFTVSSHIGKCGMSYARDLGRIAGGRGITERFEVLCAELYRTRAFVSESVAHYDTAPEGYRTHAEMCTDPDACSRFAIPTAAPAAALDTARRAADASWLPQTVWRTDDTEAPFRSAAFIHDAPSAATGVEPLVTVLPAAYYEGRVTA